jgi:hypothetical protein
VYEHIAVKVDLNDPCGYKNAISQMYKRFIELTENITKSRLEKIHSCTKVKGPLQYIGQQQVLNYKYNLTANRTLKFVIIGINIRKDLI